MATLPEIKRNILNNIVGMTNSGTPN
jgi:hypothetical protein